MRVRIPLLIPATALLLQACGGDPSTPTASGASSNSASAAQSSSDRSQISCAEFFSELREGVLGHLRGTEDLPLIQAVTAVSASTYASGAQSSAPVQVPEYGCRMAGRSLRKNRKPATYAAYPLAPACAAFIERIDRECLQPLVQRSEAFSQSCNSTLIAQSSFRDDRATGMQNDSYCQGL